MKDLTRTAYSPARVNSRSATPDPSALATSAGPAQRDVLVAQAAATTPQSGSVTRPPAVRRLAQPPTPNIVRAPTDDQATNPIRHGPLIFPSGPKNGADIAVASVKRLISPGASHLEAGTPIPLYNLPNNAKATVRDGHLEGAAEAGMFYYYVTDDGTPISRVEVGTNAATGSAHAGGVSFKPLPEVPQAVDQLASLDQLQKGSYEVRLLVYSILVGRGASQARYVIWLKADNGDADLFYPVPSASPFPTSTPIGTLSTAAEFVQSLRGPRGTSGGPAVGP